MLEHRARLDFSVIIQVLAMEKVSGAMQVVSSDGKEGKIWVEDGVLIHAETSDGFEGVKALEQMLDWAPGTVFLMDGVKAPRNTVGRPLDEVMLELVASVDESNWNETFNFVILEQEGGGEVAGKDMEKVLDALAALAGFEGAAVVSDEGLILASKFVKKYAQDKVAALVSETLNLAKKVVTEADWGNLDNMVIESQKGSKMVIYKTDLGFIVLIGNADLNLGLARVTVDEAAETLDKG